MRKKWPSLPLRDNGRRCTRRRARKRRPRGRPGESTSRGRSCSEKIPRSRRREAQVSASDRAQMCRLVKVAQRLARAAPEGYKREVEGCIVLYDHRMYRGLSISLSAPPQVPTCPILRKLAPNRRPGPRSGPHLSVARSRARRVPRRSRPFRPVYQLPRTLPGPPVPPRKASGGSRPSSYAKPASNRRPTCNVSCGEGTCARREKKQNGLLTTLFHSFEILG